MRHGHGAAIATLVALAAALPGASLTERAVPGPDAQALALARSGTAAHRTARPAARARRSAPARHRASAGQVTAPSALAPSVSQGPVDEASAHTALPPGDPVSVSEPTPGPPAASGPPSPGNAPMAQIPAPPTVEAIIRRSGSAADESADLARARELRDRGRGAEAQALLRHALLQWPGHVRSRLALAEMMSAQGQGAGAQDLLLEGAVLDPVHFAAAAARLQAQHEDLDGALATLERVPSAQRDAEHHALVAALAQRAGRPEQAVTEFRAALATGPVRGIWLVALGTALEQVGRTAEAVEAYQEAPRRPDISPAAADFARQRASILAR